KESGIENLSIGNKQSDKTGWDEESYTENGTGAYDVHYSHIIHFKYSQNCWVKNVHTYLPEENDDDVHILSNCLLLNLCKNITVDSCFFQKPQYEGGGGNGYMYTLSSNDCLIKNSRANHSRHNYDFKYPYSNGNVIHNCIGENSKYSSDFHMYLSMSNLFDVFTVNGDYLESTFRPYGGDAIHGYSSTQSVFYNTIGEAYHPNRDYIIESKQYGWGYVIGTSGPADNIKIDPIASAINGYQYNTAPRDFHEGVGEGDGLRPWSLYLDQLDRRINIDTNKHSYSINILILDEITLEPIDQCEVKVYEELKTTDITGRTSFTDVPEMLIINLDKIYYHTVENKQVSIYSDTTLTFYLAKKEYNVMFEVFDSNSNNAIWYASVSLGELSEVTNSSGKVEFEVMEGNYAFSIAHDSYLTISGNIEIISDTIIQYHLIPSAANVKFRLKRGTTPVNKASVILGIDTLKSSSLGIVNFYNLAISETYSYNIFKTGYENVEGDFFLRKDTTINIQMTELNVFTNEIQKGNEIEYWPNPVQGNLNLKFPKSSFSGLIKIININGAIFYSKTVIYKSFFTIDTSKFPNGAYIVNTSNEFASHSKVFIIQK
ncbi:MAG: T9SS type A sorting domain-containing protein, partial [Mariniphaga sp.]|nr:T9SS type A sorting domain-containing protein [Mariniphaga sp.]